MACQVASETRLWVFFGTVCGVHVPHAGLQWDPFHHVSNDFIEIKIICCPAILVLKLLWDGMGKTKVLVITVLYVHSK